MKLYQWLFFSLGVAFVAVLYLGVIQLTRFNDKFDLGRLSPDRVVAVVSLSPNRIAVANTHSIKTYNVSQSGDLELIDIE